MSAEPIDKTVELAAEQKYFDRAMRRHVDAQHQIKKSQAGAGGSAADIRALSRALKSGDTLGPNDPVAIGRVDTQDERKIYVGKSAILDENRDLLVASWKSKAGNWFYSATPENPSGVNRKRTFRTDRNTVKDFSDLVFAQLENEIAALERGEVRLDDELLESLEAGRTDSMGDIVRTIQAAQYDVIAHTPKSLLIIQGGPGTGKTAVALHRVSWLLFNQQGLRPEDVLVVGPSTTLVKYIQDVVPSLGDDGVRHAALEDLVRDLVVPRHTEQPARAALKGDARMQHVLAEGLRLRVRTGGESLKVKRSNTAGSIQISSMTVRNLIRPLSYLPYGEGRHRFIEALRGECLRSLGTRADVSFEREFDTSSFNQQVDRVWPSLSPLQFLRELFGSRNRTSAAGGHELTSEELNLLYRRPQRYISDEPWSIEDAFLLHEVEALMDPGNQLRFDHIVVDEAQDLSGMQLQALARRSRTGAMTLVGDIAQSTGPFARNSWNEIINALEKKGVPASRRTLKHVYRVPNEIFRIAVALQSEIAPDLDAAESVRSSGSEPRVLSAWSGDVSRVVLECAREHSADGLMVGVIAAAPMLAEIAARMDSEGVRYSMADTGTLGKNINLIRPETAKGLEFDAVVIADPKGIYHLDSGARLLYIALTRSTARLDMILAGENVPALLRPVLPSLEVVSAPPPFDVDDRFDQENSNSDEVDELLPLAHGVVVGAKGSPPLVSAPLRHLSDTSAYESPPSPKQTAAVSIADRLIDVMADTVVAELRAVIAPGEVIRVARRIVELLDDEEPHPARSTKNTYE